MLLKFNMYYHPENFKKWHTNKYLFMEQQYIYISYNQERVIMAHRNVNELWNEWSLHNKPSLCYTTRNFDPQPIQAQSRDLHSSVIWWKMCRRSKHCHTCTILQQNNRMKLNGLAFWIASWRHVVWLFGNDTKKK